MKEIALVTGANKGLGKEIARRLAAAGLTVYLGARDATRGRGAAAELGAAGLDVQFVPLDVTVEEQVVAAVRAIEEECGRLDVLVNNAGIVTEWGLFFEDITADHLRRSFEVNVLGAVTVTRACLPLLRRSKGARVVNMSSPLGSLTLLDDPDHHPAASRGLLAYSSSKAALNAVTLVYAEALRAAGIRVNAANPGLVVTDLNADSPYPRGTRSVEEGAEVPVRLALDAEGTGGFHGSMEGDVTERVPW
ncbi:MULTISPECIES: SDR family NAD(P)-dependent oxidoreductase [unclassified Streptomyces]|uniref:SDR family NAD(P)-dependent oxidoreductase n=1 Tax=unclassified Streptomyces TaxID=2593676 RepID=UPI002E17C809